MLPPVFGRSSSSGSALQDSNIVRGRVLYKNQHKKEYDRRWDNFSKRYRKKNPLCVECLKRNRTQPSEHVDHIVPLSLGGKKFDEANLQALCKRCHSRKTIYDGSRMKNTHTKLS